MKSGPVRLRRLTRPVAMPTPDEGTMKGADRGAQLTSHAGNAGRGAPRGARVGGRRRQKALPISVDAYQRSVERLRQREGGRKPVGSRPPVIVVHHGCTIGTPGDVAWLDQR